MHIFDLVLGLDTAHVLSMPFLLSSTCPDSLIPLGAHYTSSKVSGNHSDAGKIKISVC